MPRSAPLFAAAIALLMTASAANAAHQVWSGLIIAQNAEQPQPAPAELKSLEGTLRDLFGYNQFEVIGQSHKTLATGQEDWLAASKYFSLRVDAQGADEAGYELNLQLFQEKECLLETHTKLSQRSPLVIKGPQVGGGQLLLVLFIEEEPQKTQGNAGHHHTEHRPNKFVTMWRHISRIFHDGSK